MASYIHFLYVFVLAVFVAVGDSQSIEFVNPPPAGPDSVYTDDQVFVLGSIVDIQWTSTTSDYISLVMYQQRPDADLEYIFQNVSGLTSYTWTVGTAQNLSVTNVFFFEIFITPQTSPSAVSHYFNLTKAAGAEASTTTSGTSVASTTSPTNATASTVLPASTTTTTSATSSPTVSSTSGGLDTGTKVGIGIGIPLAVIAGCLAGFFLFRHYARKENNAPPPASAAPYVLTPSSHELKITSMGPQWPVPSTASASDIRGEEHTSPVEMPADHRNTI
ncbi:hypothetical protein VTN77DRAFT_325 [Rasamsonia byssochlamydoides]|uniref:uncharacterized protein n=1 Tax=Rasamsonia byssochlamydoides TaxID=89139 RepID=UPI0037423AC4